MYKEYSTSYESERLWNVWLVWMEMSLSSHEKVVNCEHEFESTSNMYINREQLVIYDLYINKVFH